MKANVRIMVAIATLAVVAFAAMAAAVELRAGENITVSGEYSDLVFAAGEEVTLSLTSTDDVAASGSRILVRGARLDHAFLGGRAITFLDSDAHDVLAAGAELDFLSGTIADDLVAAGARITLAEETRIDGSAMLAARTITVRAPIGADLRAAGRRVEIDTTIGGDVFLDADTIIISPETHISGALSHRGRNVQIAPEAQIDGTITALTARPEPDYRRVGQIAGWLAASVFAGFVLLALVVAVALPRLMNETAGVTRRRPFSMLGLGFLIFVLAPVLFGFLVVSVFGLALGFLIAALYAVLWPLALAGAAYTAGMLIRSRARPNAPDAPAAGARILWSALGLTILVVLGLIPILGPILWLLAFLFGLGAVSLELVRSLAMEPAALPAAPEPITPG